MIEVRNQDDPSVGSLYNRVPLPHYQFHNRKNGPLCRPQKHEREKNQVRKGRRHFIYFINGISFTKSSFRPVKCDDIERASSWLSESPLLVKFNEDADSGRLVDGEALGGFISWMRFWL